MEGLPSIQKYKELTEKSENYHNESSNQELGRILNGSPIDSDMRRRIRRAFSYIENKGEKEKIQHYDPFYCWVGEVLSRFMENDELERTINEFEEKVLQRGSGKSSTSGYTVNRKKVFGALKKVFDYSIDKEVIGKRIAVDRQPCPPEHQTYLQSVKDAYETMGQACAQRVKSEWCTKYETWSGIHGEQHKLELKCTLNPGSSGSGSTGTCELGSDGDPDKLPSEEMYDKFTKPQCTNTDKPVDQTVKTTLEPLLGNIENKVKQVLGAWYCAEGMEGSGGLCGERCEFLYFYIGDFLPDAVNDSSISGTMQGIFSALHTIGGGQKCPPKYNKEISRSLFKNGKKVFDYYHDHSRIEQKLQDRGTNNKETYCRRVQDAAEAYRRVQDICGPRNVINEYCVEFEMTYKDHNPQVLLNRMCKSILEKERAKSQLQQHSAGKSVSTAVSSALATIALPTALFFLYKYTSLFGGIKNSFGGGSSNISRNRKRRSVRRDLNTFSDDSTDYSTIASSSNLTTSESTDVSTVYVGRPPSRGRANNRRGQQQRNVSYQRM